MLMAIVSDTLFFAAFFVESLALISIFQAAYALPLNDALIPVMRAYHVKTAPVSAFGASLFAAPPWYADAAIIAAVLFFSFFIAQARNAMAPYGDGHGAAYETARIEAAIDLILPAAFCAIGAVVTAPALLPFLTPPIALWLLIKRAAGKPSWFEVSPSYYVNLALLGGVAAAIFALAR
ncbi:MAG: hypothetical protein WAN43_08320 [Rhodomicrobium sp.]